uniref:Peptidase S1 domain-containing protein n=1 Tax=Panagrolaimus sp. JU765 TaxID=591449 RepID=A0AC34RBK6_9BILA
MFGKEIWASLLLLSLLAVSTAEDRIYNGKAVPKDDLLNVVELQIFHRYPKRVYECTGTIISEHHVLTVAHCLHKGTQEPHFVLVFARDKNESIFLGRHWKIHPDYSSENHVNDIAIITVEQPMGIPSVLLAADYTQLVGDSLRVAAYDKGVFVDTYAQGYVKEVCQFPDVYLNVKGICVYHPETKTLPGDHGGPSFKLGKDDKYYQVAINLLVGFPLGGGFASLSNNVSYYCPWIEQTTGGEVKCQSFNSDKSEIDDDTDVPFIDLPYVVKLQINFQDKTRGCTGTIISDYYVLTAAHCLDDHPIAVKIQNRVNNRLFDAARWTIHPGYSRDRFDHDIAIISVQQYMQTRPALLAANYTQKDKEWLRVAGYGDTKYEFKNGSAVHFKPAETLMETYVYGYSKESCSLAARYPGVNGICLIHQKGKLTGDSGGPSFALGKDGKYYQVGVTSFGGISSDGIIESVDTDVSYYCPWIEQTTGGKVKCQTFKPTPIVPEF